jgi:hypothetical protein
LPTPLLNAADQVASLFAKLLSFSFGELRSLFATLEKLMDFEKSIAGNAVPLEAQPIPTLSDRVRAAGARA